MSDDISEELIRIIKSYSNNNDLVNSIYYLLTTNVLTNKERKLCNKILDQIELLNTFDLINIINEIDSDFDINDVGCNYKSDELIEKINEFIGKRKRILIEVMRKVAFQNIVDSNYDKETIDFVYNRYPEDINIKEDDTFDNLEVLIESNEEILTGYYSIDAYLKGLIAGTITTIVGSNAQQKNMLCLNIAYNVICKNKNVLFLSIGATKMDVYKRLLIRHSRSKKIFTKLRLNTSYDIRNNEYAKVYYDFKENLLSNIIVADESDYYMSTHFSLLKVLCAYDNQFKNTTGRGIDLIVVDEMSKMKLFDGRKYVNNRNTIANEIYSFLKNQSSSLLSSGKPIPIITTYESIKNNQYNAENNIPDIIYNLSDNIILLINDQVDVSLSQLYFQIFKNLNGSIMNAPVKVSCEYEHWYVYDTIPDYEEDSKQALEEARKENEKLLLDNQAYIGNSNIIIGKLNDIGNNLDSINDKLSNKEKDIFDLSENVSNGAVIQDILAEFDLD